MVYTWSVPKVWERGSANCYQVWAHTGVYFLKEYQSTFSEMDIEKEVRLLSFLNSKAYPASKLVLPKDHRGYVEYKDRWALPAGVRGRHDLWKQRSSGSLARCKERNCLAGCMSS